MTKDFDFENFKLMGEIFYQTLQDELLNLGFEVGVLRPDHLCFRVATPGEYADYKNKLLRVATLLTETSVNGRPIATFRLPVGFRTPAGSIDLLELPFPKDGSPYPTGFEHAEFVCDESFEQIQRKFPKLQFTRSGHKNFNAELVLKTVAGQAKFHHLSLDRVIEIENGCITDVIFDLDGTLIQSRAQIYEINRQVFSAICERPISLQESRDKFSPEFSKLFQNFEVTAQQKKAAAIDMWGKIANQFEYPLFDGAFELLEELRGKNLKLHLWTARGELSARECLRRHKIEDFFTTMSFANEVQSKPHASSLRWDWLTAKPNSVLMIGDSPTDIWAAKNTNCVAAAALWDSHADEHSVAASGAELYFHEISDLKTWLAAKLAGPSM